MLTVEPKPMKTLNVIVILLVLLFAGIGAYLAIRGSSFSAILLIGAGGRSELVPRLQSQTFRPIRGKPLKGRFSLFRGGNPPADDLILGLEGGRGPLDKSASACV